MRKYVGIYREKCYICSHNIIKTTDEYIQKIIAALLRFASVPSECGCIFDAAGEHRPRGAWWWKLPKPMPVRVKLQ